MDERYVCEVCDLSFDSDDELQEHRVEAHGAEDPISSDESRVKSKPPRAA